jgi:hypothetical protein
MGFSIFLGASAGYINAMLAGWLSFPATNRE